MSAQVTERDTALLRMRGPWINLLDELAIRGLDGGDGVQFKNDTISYCRRLVQFGDTYSGPDRSTATAARCRNHALTRGYQGNDMVAAAMLYRQIPVQVCWRH